MVGMSGSNGERFAPVTASARMRPSRMKPVAVGALAISDGTWPATRSFIAGPPPRNGTWFSRAPLRAFRSSPARWPALPTPDVP